MKSISKGTLNNAFLNIVKRMSRCISIDDDRFEHLLQGEELCENKL